MIQAAQFNAAAPTYDQFATIQTQIGQALVNRIYLSTTINKSVLDYGCGTGSLTSQLKQHATLIIGYDPAPEMIEHACQTYTTKKHTIHWTSALSVIQNYAPFSLIFSNAALQWENDLQNTIHFLAKNCQNQLLFSAFGPQTFQELASIWPTPIIATQFHPLPNYESIVSHYFQHVSASYHRTVHEYASLSKLLQTIKGTGAYIPAISGLLTPRQFKQLESDYLNQYGSIKATYDYIIVDGRH